ncbi:MAG: polyphosphate kinase 1 [Mucilaginibacter polytrichastri]|nr:polyphosphate kinase 1 [Mucilaginibacter polytrichastri]
MQQPVYANRDISWLRFNLRVLQEAADAHVPLYERINFLSIYSSNLDEFFRVRMPSILAIKKLTRNSSLEMDDDYPEGLADRVQEIVQQQQDEYGRLLREEIIPALKSEHIHLVYNEDLPDEHRDEARHYFLSRILSFLQPVWLDGQPTEPAFLENNALYFILSLRKKDEQKQRYALLNIPSGSIPRFRQFSSGAFFTLVFLDDIIREHAGLVFPGYDVERCHAVKMTRDAEIDIVEDLHTDMANAIEKMMVERDLGAPTRFLYEQNMPDDMRHFLAGYFQLGKKEMVKGGRYHNLKDLSALPNPLGQKLRYPAALPLVHPVLDACVSVFEAMREQDMLLHLPYQSYDHILRFFNEAAIDPAVVEINVTLYRIAADSHIANALISAAKNGKSVTVFVELKARFDEANNLKWAKKMKAAGVQIVYSIPGIKVHAKTALVHRRTGLVNEFYGLLATGNFNENTARFYTDEVLLTCNPDLTREMNTLFAYLQTREPAEKYRFLSFSSLLVSQFNLQDEFIRIIQREAQHAINGIPAKLVIKMNNLQERHMINELYRASCAGVKITLIIRGICCLVPGIPGLSENIRMIRIVGRYLEHARIFYSENGSDNEVYMGSADWMNRNLHRRIEVCFPIHDQQLKQKLISLLEIQCGSRDGSELVTDAYAAEAMPGSQAERAQDAVQKFLAVRSGAAR